MATIPEEFMDIMNSKALASFATTMADGSPQVSPVWFSFDGSLVWVNSAEGRVKDKNVRRTRKVALAIVDVDNPYRHIAIRVTSSRSRTTAPMITSTRWPRSTWTQTSIRTGRKQKSA